MSDVKDPDSSGAETSRPSFESLYDRAAPAYGWSPTAEVEAVLEVCQPGARALDLGCGAGRDTLAIARRGLSVRAVDASPRGVERLREAATEQGLDRLIEATSGDVRDLAWAEQPYGLIVAVTLLDHLAEPDIRSVWAAMIGALKPDGLLVVQVHTTDDPASPIGRGAVTDAPISESAIHVVHYFRPNELLAMASDLRVLRYEERLEWDQTHGRPHQHGKASLIAMTWSAPSRFTGLPARGRR